MSYTLRNFATLPCFKLFDVFLGQFGVFLAISVSICAKLARSILMTDCNGAQLSKTAVEFCRRKTVTCPLRTSTSSSAASLDRSVTSVRPLTNRSILILVHLCLDF